MTGMNDEDLPSLHSEEVVERERRIRIRTVASIVVPIFVFATLIIGGYEFAVRSWRNRVSPSDVRYLRGDNLARDTVAFEPVPAHLLSDTVHFKHPAVPQ